VSWTCRRASDCEYSILPAGCANGAEAWEGSSLPLIRKPRMSGAPGATSKVPVTIAGIYGIFGSQVQRDKVDHPKFIDLFCGIGGMRLAFESAGAECVFSSDWDKYAQQTYAANFGDAPAGNIREIKASNILDHDILVGGFPCQPFSISGVSKKNSLGREHGFKGDEAVCRTWQIKADFSSVALSSS